MKTRIIVAAACVAALIPVGALAAGMGHDHDGHGWGGWGRGGEGMMERLDKNRDGQISADEAAAGSADMFKRLDLNGDGTITPDEAPDLFERPDANGDGKITPDELAAAAKARIMRPDANGDGIVTMAELETYHDAMKTKHKAAHDRWRAEHKGEGHEPDGDDEPPPPPPQ